MEKRINVENIAGGFNQMTAPDGYFLTQVNDVDTLERLYVRRRILLASESVTDWRLADESEMLRHEKILE